MRGDGILIIISINVSSVDDTSSERAVTGLSTG